MQNKKTFHGGGGGYGYFLELHNQVMYDLATCRLQAVQCTCTFPSKIVGRMMGKSRTA